MTKTAKTTRPKSAKAAPGSRETAASASRRKSDLARSADTHKAKAAVPKTAQPRASSKTGAVLALLRTKEGASIADMQKATGWQAQTVRGFLSGTVKLRLGLKLSSIREGDDERRYRVVDG